MAAESAGLSCTPFQGQTENTTNKLENIYLELPTEEEGQELLGTRRKGKVWRGADPGLRGSRPAG